MKLDVLEALERIDAIKNGHFRLTSGLHSDTYIQCSKILDDPSLTMDLAAQSVEQLPPGILESIDKVASPAVGGIVFGFAVATVLNKPFVFAERVNGKMTLRRSFSVEPEEKILIVEDVVTTGGSVKEVCDVVESFGGRVESVISLVDRQVDKKFNAPFYPLLRVEVQSWEPEKCKLCAQGIDIETLGSRGLQNNTNYR